MTSHLPKLWVIAGAPGAGKSTLARTLLPKLAEQTALLDKDTMFEPLVRSMLTSHERPAGEYEGSWYETHVKPFEYEALFSTAKEVRAGGCAVAICAPFTSYARDVDKWRALVDACGGGDVQLIWMQSDAATLHDRLSRRGLARDRRTVEAFDAFAQRIELDRLPVVDHWLVKTNSAASVEDQVMELLRAQA